MHVFSGIIFWLAIFIIAVAGFVLYLLVSVLLKDKIRIYKKKIRKAEKKKGSPLTKAEKEIIAQEVDELDARKYGHLLDIHAIAWRYAVDDEDVRLQQTEDEKNEIW
jgi:hypothetical protein